MLECQEATVFNLFHVKQVLPAHWKRCQKSSGKHVILYSNRQMLQQCDLELF